MLGFLGDVFQAGAGFLSRSLVLTLLLTLGLPCFLLLLLFFQIKSEPLPLPIAVVTVQQPTVVAKVTQTIDCVWNEPDGAMLAGTPLSTGQPLRLRQGLVELTFTDGAKVILKGPATFEARGVQQGFLHVGSLVAQVGKGSEGFTVATPTVTVVDLGTEFGLSVADNGTVETHVFKGQVEVATRATPGNPAPKTTHLEAGQAVRIPAVKVGQTPRIIAMAAIPGQFVRHLSTPSKPKIQFAHRGSADPITEGWRFQRLRDKGFKDAKIDPSAMVPVADGGTAAWMLNNRVNKEEIRYSIAPGHGLSSEVVKKSKNGWVMRARIKLDNMG